MAGRIERAVQSGKLKPGGTYTIGSLAALIGTSRGHLRQAVNRDFGSIDGFLTHVGFAGRK